MANANSQEFIQTELRCAFNNQWLEQGCWIGNVQQDILDKLSQIGKRQLLEIPRLNEGAATILYENPQINRLFSAYLDVLDQLPLHPDVAFDEAWRVAEIALSLHEGSDSLETKLLRCLQTDWVDRISNIKLADATNRILEHVSYSSLRLVSARMFASNEMAVNEDLKMVASRCQSILGNDLYSALKSKYAPAGDLSADNHHKLILFLRLLIKGDKLNIKGKEFQLSFRDRLMFIFYCVLYSSRCERFHGDYFSPFKSERSNLRTAYSYYWMLLITLALSWLLFHAQIKRLGVEELFSLDEVADCINSSLDRMLLILNNSFR